MHIRMYTIQGKIHGNHKDKKWNTIFPNCLQMYPAESVLDVFRPSTSIGHLWSDFLRHIFMHYLSYSEQNEAHKLNPVSFC